MSEVETVEEIKANMAEQPQEQEVNQEVQEEPKQEEPKKLPLNVRLDNAYRSLDETGKEAWSQGWRPEEFFVGKRRDGSERPFIDAKEFLSKTKDSLPVANDRLRKLTEELEETRRIAKKAEERISKAEQKGYEKALAEIEARQSEAVELGDTEAFKKLKEEEKDLINSKYQQPEAVVEEVVKPDEQPKPQQNLLTPKEEQTLQDWSARNSWMRTDHKLAGYAIAAEKQLLNEKPYLSLNERLNIVEQEVKEVFHSKFNTSESSSMFDSGVNKGFGSAPKQKGYADLSAEAKKNCESLMKIRGIEGKDKIERFKQTYAKNFQY